MRSFDWTTTPLGSPENWPPALRRAIRNLLTVGADAGSNPRKVRTWQAAVPNRSPVACDSADVAALDELSARVGYANALGTVGILFFRTDGTITGANEAFLLMTGYTRDDVRGAGLHWERLAPPGSMPPAMRAGDGLQAPGRIVPYEREYVRKDGSRWWGLFAATRLSEDEGVGFVIDVTNRRAVEEQLRNTREELELRVQERTAELDAVNGALRDEIVERRRAEHDRQELLRQLVAAQEEERRRISRELHDQVGQHVTALLLGLKAIEQENPGGRIASTLASLKWITEQIGREIHQLALELRPTALDDLGLIGALSNYVEEWSTRSGLAVDVHTSGFGSERLPPHVETTLYRIVQEALNNVLKHAAARRVSVILEKQPNQAVAIVEDDGRGFKLEAPFAPNGSKRLGLLGMQERAALAGGEVTIESKAKHGTTVFVRIPLPAAREAQP